jgi:hypothetical protein
VEALSDAADLAPGVGDRLADVAGLQLRELFEVGLDQSGDGPQAVASHRQW